MSAISSVVISESHLCHCSAMQQYIFRVHAQAVVETTWYGDVHFKQCTVTAFLVADKESLISIHKQLKT
jgi:hypothetical protein